ncbi:MAG: hypothetical protein AAGI51_18560, partial [Pseudomonadota bacterium]
MEGLGSSPLLNAAFVSLVFPVLVGIFNRLAERGTAKDARARLELVGESLDVLAKLEAVAAARPALKAESDRLEAVIAAQCADIAVDLDESHAARLRRGAERRRPLLPPPEGVFGRLWWFLALAATCLAVLMIVLLFFVPPSFLEDEPDFYFTSAAQIFLVGLLALIFR